MSAEDRRRYREILALSVAVMEETLSLRLAGSKNAVPPIGTPAWLAHCLALTHGDYDAAEAHLRAKQADLRL